MKKILRSLVLAVASSLVLLSVPVTSLAADQNQGMLFGRAFTLYLCPIAYPGSICQPNHPYIGQLDILDSTQTRVLNRIKTDQTGIFVTKLAPGTYYLTLPHTSGLGEFIPPRWQQSFEFTITPHHVTIVRANFDSGIR